MTPMTTLWDPLWLVCTESLSWSGVLAPLGLREGTLVVLTPPRLVTEIEGGWTSFGDGEREKEIERSLLVLEGCR